MTKNVFDFKRYTLLISVCVHRLIRTRFLTFPLFPKVKEVQFKIINDIYPCNEFLRHRFNMECNECTFCEADIESLALLFFISANLQRNSGMTFIFG